MSNVRTRDCFCLALIVLVVVQLNALPIHEFNLRQQGYTLVNPHLVEAESGSGPSEISPKKHDFYNIAQCETHFFLSLNQQFEKIDAGPIDTKTVMISLQTQVLASSLQRDDYFLSVLSSRAPPVV